MSKSPRISHLLLGLALLHGAAGAAPLDDIKLDNIEDVFLGESVFTTLSGDAKRAVAQLKLANDFQRLQEDNRKAQLYLAHTYLKLGLADEAKTVYRQLATTARDPRIRAEGWLNLARIAYDAGHLSQAREAMQRVNVPLDAAPQADADALRALLLADQNDLEAALRIVGPLRTQSVWSVYERYNLAVLLLRRGEGKNGAILLHEMGSLDAKGDPELLAIRDQANVTLGFTLLQMNKPQHAQTYLQKVRLNGPFSAMALLGMGWVYSAREDYERALVFWLELQRRPLMNAYVYESLLAVPYALGRSKAYSQAAEHYTQALSRFGDEIKAIDTAIAAINDGALVAQLSIMPRQEFDWIEGWRGNPRAAHNRYLPLFMENDAFQLALRNQRWLLETLAYIDSIGEDVRRAGATMPARLAGQLPSLEERQRQLRVATDQALTDNRQILQSLAVNILERYKNQLRTYQDQARFGLAQIIEQATQEGAR